MQTRSGGAARPDWTGVARMNASIARLVRRCFVRNGVYE